MQISVAIEYAERIARLIRRGERHLNETRFCDLPILARLPFFCIKEYGLTVPVIDDILVFGSVARGEEEVGDVDVMVLDRGFYSSFFWRFKCEEGDAYNKIQGNLRELLIGWFGLPHEDPETSAILTEVPVDLHVLPAEILRSPEVRAKLASKHSDPNFFENAFSALLRWDGHRFVPITIEELEERHRTPFTTGSCDEGCEHDEDPDFSPPIF